MDNMDTVLLFTWKQMIFTWHITDVEKRFATSTYELNISLQKEKNKKVIGVMKDKLGEKIMKEFVG